MDDRKKEALKAKINSAIDNYDAKIDKLESEGKKLSAEAREKFDKIIADLRVKRDEVKKSSESAFSTASNALSEMKVGFKDAVLDINNGIKNASKELKKKK
ncbi:MAG: hypothetical protein RBT69_11870 [Spirochaetia bacterium]|jgi:hypothetical protein|nr:hypothetical protein [Spirochaetia bacterium]